MAHDDPERADARERRTVPFGGVGTNRRSASAGGAGLMRSRSIPAAGGLMRAVILAIAAALVFACAPAARPTAPPPTAAPAATAQPPTTQPAAGKPATTTGDTAKPATPAQPVATQPPAATPTAAAAESTRPGSTQKVTLILDWYPNTNHSGIYLAQAKGWYAAQGVEVDIQQPSDPSASMKLVGANKAELGISYQPAVEIARAQDIPVVSVAAILQHNTAAYAAKSGRNVGRPKDFEGKRFGSSGLAQVEPTLRTVMACDGADIARVEIVNVGQKLTPALLSDQVDVISMLPAWEGVDLELKGNQLSYVPQVKFCVPDLYTLVFIASEQGIQEKGDAIRRFLAATAQGYEYAARNPAEAADVLLKASPELAPELVRKSQVILSTQYLAEAPRWGVQAAEQWKRHADWMAENKLIPKAIDTSKAFTNDLMPRP